MDISMHINNLVPRDLPGRWSCQTKKGSHRPRQVKPMMKMKLNGSNGKILSKASSRDKMKLSNISVTNWRLGVGKSRNSTSYSSKPRQHCQRLEKGTCGGGSGNGEEREDPGFKLD
jgi:hypothetical protein